MVRAIMHGCNGAMGQVISGIAAKDEEISIVAGIDMRTEQKNDYPVFASLNECKVEADVVIDFSNEAAKETAVLRSANMSLGINMLLKLLKEAAQILAPAGFDIEILEKHHNQKVDAPSGTAIALADSINEAMGNTYHYKYDRSATREKRDAKEIGIQAIRGGTIVGEHDVIFAGQDEVITFNHTAYSKAIFAKGAVQAAKFLAGKPEGRYDMADVIG